MDDDEVSKLSASKDNNWLEILVNWKDDPQEWVPLKLLKESNPVEVAEFVIDQNIAYETAFSW